MKHCKVCEAKDARQEILLDGRPILLCRVCRQYLKGLLQTCENCAYYDNCLKNSGFPPDTFYCNEWHAGRV